MCQQIFKAVQVAAVLALAGCGTARMSAPAEAPLEIAMSAILKDPWRHDGKLVRVRGTFDECISFTCEFCETSPPPSDEEERKRTCMEVSFSSETEALEPAGSEEHLSLMQGRAEALAERNARFTTATLEARYNAACSSVQKKAPNPDGSQEVTICTDRASQLMEARIVQVHVRRPATAAHLTMYFGEELTKAGKDDADQIETAFRAGASAFDRDREIAPDYLYVWKDQPVAWLKEFGIEALGGACTCRLKDCGGIEWPRRFGDATFDIPANPYKCWLAEKRGGVWRFPLE